MGGFISFIWMGSWGRHLLSEGPGTAEPLCPPGRARYRRGMLGPGTAPHSPVPPPGTVPAGVSCPVCCWGGRLWVRAREAPPGAPGCGMAHGKGRMAEGGGERAQPTFPGLNLCPHLPRAESVPCTLQRQGQAPSSPIVQGHPLRTP